eukprot:gene31719-41170_t
MQTRSSPNIQTLHRLAQRVSFEGYETLPKGALYKKLQENYDIDRLIRAESRRNKVSEVQSKKRKLAEEEPLNKYDPIMFTPIDKKHVFKFSRPNGTVVRFNIESLVDYLLVSGDFNDPETRIQFSDENLKEIDAIAKTAGLTKASVFEAKKNTNAYTESRFRRDALLGLERCAGEVITDMLEIVETFDPDEAQMQLAMREFPSFLDYYRQIKEADPEYAAKCIAHWRLFMQGPPNKPNKDDYGLIYIICHFLRTVAEGHI